MATERKFSDVTHAFNHNAANLNEARKVFEGEIEKFHGYILEHVEAVVKRVNQEERMKGRFTFEEPENEARKIAGPWLSYYGKTIVALHVRAPKAKVFRKNVAYLEFRTSFDASGANRFIFECRFENQNVVHEGLDEKLMELAQAKANQFPNAEHFKNDTTVLFRRELEDKLLDDVNQLVDLAVGLCQEMLMQTFTDAAYRVEKEGGGEQAVLPQAA